MYGPPEEHDLPLRPRHMSDVWRQDGGVPHMSKGGGKADPSVLVTLKKVDRSASDSGKVVEKQIPPYSWWKAEQVMDGIIYVIDIISWKLRC